MLEGLPSAYVHVRHINFKPQNLNILLENSKSHKWMLNINKTNNWKVVWINVLPWDYLQIYYTLYS